MKQTRFITPAHLLQPGDLTVARVAVPDQEFGHDKKVEVRLEEFFIFRRKLIVIKTTMMKDGVDILFETEHGGRETLQIDRTELFLVLRAQREQEYETKTIL